MLKINILVYIDNNLFKTTMLIFIKSNIKKNIFRYTLYDIINMIVFIHFRHDLVDVTRQGLQLTMDILYPKIVQAFKNKNLTAFG